MAVATESTGQEGHGGAERQLLTALAAADGGGCKPAALRQRLGALFSYLDAHEGARPGGEPAFAPAARPEWGDLGAVCRHLARLERAGGEGEVNRRLVHFELFRAWLAGLGGGAADAFGSSGDEFTEAAAWRLSGAQYLAAVRGMSWRGEMARALRSLPARVREEAEAAIAEAGGGDLLESAGRGPRAAVEEVVACWTDALPPPAASWAPVPAAPTGGAGGEPAALVAAVEARSRGWEGALVSLAELAGGAGHSPHGGSGFSPRELRRLLQARPLPAHLAPAAALAAFRSLARLLAGEGGGADADAMAWAAAVALEGCGKGAVAVLSEVLTAEEFAPVLGAADARPEVAAWAARAMVSISNRMGSSAAAPPSRDGGRVGGGAPAEAEATEAAAQATLLAVAPVAALAPRVVVWALVMDAVYHPGQGPAIADILRALPALCACRPPPKGGLALPSSARGIGGAGRGGEGVNGRARGRGLLYEALREALCGAGAPLAAPGAARACSVLVRALAAAPLGGAEPGAPLGLAAFVAECALPALRADAPGHLGVLPAVRVLRSVLLSPAGASGMGEAPPALLASLARVAAAREAAGGWGGSQGVAGRGDAAGTEGGEPLVGEEAREAAAALLEVLVGGQGEGRGAARWGGEALADVAGSVLSWRESASLLPALPPGHPTVRALVARADSAGEAAARLGSDRGLLDVLQLSLAFASSRHAHGCCLARALAGDGAGGGGEVAAGEVAAALAAALRSAAAPCLRRCALLALARGLPGCTPAEAASLLTSGAMLALVALACGRGQGEVAQVPPNPTPPGAVAMSPPAEEAGAGLDVEVQVGVMLFRALTLVAARPDLVPLPEGPRPPPPPGPGPPSPHRAAAVDAAARHVTAACVHVAARRGTAVRTGESAAGAAGAAVALLDADLRAIGAVHKAGYRCDALANVALELVALALQGRPPPALEATGGEAGPLAAADPPPPAGKGRGRGADMQRPAGAGTGFSAGRGRAPGPRTGGLGAREGGDQDPRLVAAMEDVAALAEQVLRAGGMPAEVQDALRGAARRLRGAR